MAGKNQLAELAQRMSDHLKTDDDNKSDQAIASESPTRNLESQRESGKDSSPDDVSVASTTAFSFPPEAPIILTSHLPAGVTISRSLWQSIYGLLRERGHEWSDIRVFQAEYMQRRLTPLSNDYLKKNCGCSSLKQLFNCIPFVETMQSLGDAMYVRLLLNPPIAALRKSTALQDVRPHYRSRGTADKIQRDYEVDEDWIALAVPPQPAQVLPAGYQIPQHLRQRIYELLWNCFRDGIDISTFAERYTVRYGSTLATERECKMPLETTLRYMADIVDTGFSGDEGRMWIRPVSYKLVRQLCGPKELAKENRDDYYQYAPLDNNNQQQPPMSEAEIERLVVAQTRNEVVELLAPFKEEGIPIENLAVVYSHRFPHRDIDLEKVEILKEYLKRMPDIAQLFNVEDGGETRLFAKPVDGPPTK